MALAFVFPGQGSQAVGMLASLAEVDSIVPQTFAEASEALGYDLLELVLRGPAERLNTTECTQPAMLAAGIAVWRVWKSRGGPAPQAMAGHSLGEYTALVASGAVEFAEAVRLVQFRAQAMQSAVPFGRGAMAAVLGLDDEQVRRACQQAADGEVVEPANFNAPGQVVIAGHTAAVERAIEIARALGAARAVRLPVSVPSHTRLMRPAAERLGERLAAADIRMPQFARVYTVDVAVHDSVEGIREALVAQLCKPVRWVETVQRMIVEGAHAIVECGPGKVLTGLNKRIVRGTGVELFAVDGEESIQQALAAV